MTVAELIGLEPEMKKQALNSKFIESLFAAGRAAKRGAGFVGNKRNWGLENYKDFLKARAKPALGSLALHSGVGGGVLGAGAAIKDMLTTTPEEAKEERKRQLQEIINLLK